MSETSLRSVNIALDVLECFETEDFLGVTDVARRLDVAKSTAHRMLTALGRRGYIEQEETSGRYRLGAHVHELGRLSHARHRLRHVALPAMRGLADTTGLTVNLSIPDGSDMVFIERVEMPGLEEHLADAGRRLPAHVTSSGKALGAFDAKLDRARRAAGFPARVSRTVRSEEDWDRELSHVRRHGFATSESESFNDVSTVAVPIRNVDGIAIAAISLMGRTPSVQAAVPQLAHLLTVEAREIGHQL